MTRKPRETSLTGIYHVMLRGINRQDIFIDRDDFWKFIKTLHQQVNPKDELGRSLTPRCNIYSYCLMPNHIHLLIRNKTESIGSIIKSIAITYAAYFNKRYERVGHLFQDRFKSEPVNDMNYFLTLIRYIHQNPIAGGITKRVEDYPWSSWIEFLTPEKCQMPVCTTNAVTKRISLDELKALVDEPLPKSAVALESDNEDNDTNLIIEEKFNRFLDDNFNISDSQSLRNLPEAQLHEILQAAISSGFSIRRLAQITGLSRYAIQKSTTRGRFFSG